jgi:ribosomal protein S18 acetylase RimI-like enzyme
MLIRALQSEAEARACAAMMAGTDPWLTLGRDFDGALAFLTDGTKELYVAVDGHQLLGVLVLNMRGAFVGYIQTICVAAEARGGGVGSRLMGFAEERIYLESPNVFLCVSSFNVRARALYERLGYQIVGVLPDYIKRGYDEILMRKPLCPAFEFRSHKGQWQYVHFQQTGT